MALHIYPIATESPELITLTEVKKQLKLYASFTDEDDLITGYIAAAIEAAENYTNTSINQTQYNIVTDRFINNLAFLRSPVTAINSVKYFSDETTEETLASDEYDLRPIDKYQHIIHYENYDDLPSVYEKSNAVTITITTGYVQATLPKVIKQAIFLIIGSFHENRQDSVEALPKASTNLLRKYRFEY